MKQSKTAVILTADKFEDMELFFPLFRLLEEGWHVDVAARPNERLVENMAIALNLISPSTKSILISTIYSLFRVVFPMEHQQPFVRSKRPKRSRNHSSKRISLLLQSAMVPGLLLLQMYSRIGTSLHFGTMESPNQLKPRVGYGKTKRSWWMGILLLHAGRWTCRRSCER